MNDFSSDQINENQVRLNNIDWSKNNDDMETEILHQRENNEVSENHLKDNGKKFQKHCVELLRLMYKGYRLNARQVERDFNYDGRRLRDIFQHRSECKRDWKKDKDGKNLFMEYWLDIPGLPTKRELIKKADKAIETIKSVAKNKKDPPQINNPLFT